MNKFLTKKNVFFFGLGGTVIFLFCLFIMTTDACYHNRICFRFFDDSFTRTILFILVPFPSIFLFSLITYKMRDEIYQAWWNLARWWLLISTPLTLFVPEGGGPFTILGKGLVVLMSGTLFPFLSFVVVFVMFFRKKK